MSRGFKTFAFAAAFFVISGSLLIIAVLPALVTGSLINDHMDYDQVYQPEEFDVEAKQLSLFTEDALTLAAWEVETTQPKGVLLFLGGLTHPSVTAFWGHAKLFAEYGYASLLVELRAHGESAGKQVGLGYTEHLDVLAALHYLHEQEQYEGLPIVAYGVDLGGVVAINAAGLYPQLAGVISIGAYSSWADLFRDNLYFSGAPLMLALAEKPFVQLYTLAKFGWQNRHTVPQLQIAKLDSRPVLLMHSEGDEQVSVINIDRMMQRAPAQVETWIREGDQHLVCNDFLYPERDSEYVERVLSFLEHNFTQ